MIDSRAVVHKDAKVASDVEIGPFSIIGPGVEIREGSWIGPHVVIKQDTLIGKNNKIYQFASLGDDPQHIQYAGEKTYLEIGDDNIIREFCTLNRGTKQGKGTTRIGDHNFFMEYVHIAHDSDLGNHIVMANYAAIAGHVKIGDYVTFGAYCGSHQHCTVGTHSFLGRGALINKDIPPYTLVTGRPGAPNCINAVGLKRHGFSDNTIKQLRRAFNLLYRDGLKLEEAIVAIEAEKVSSPELDVFVDALKTSKRGIARPRFESYDDS